MNFDNDENPWLWSLGCEIWSCHWDFNLHYNRFTHRSYIPTMLHSFQEIHNSLFPKLQCLCIFRTYWGVLSLAAVTCDFARFCQFWTPCDASPTNWLNWNSIAMGQIFISTSCDKIKICSFGSKLSCIHKREAGITRQRNNGTEWR